MYVRYKLKKKLPTKPILIGVLLIFFLSTLSNINYDMGRHVISSEKAELSAEMLVGSGLSFENIQICSKYILYAVININLFEHNMQT